jgi:hypothetical protein
MAFTGMSTNKYFTPNLVGEDVSEVIRTLAPYEAPFLDWLGDPDGFATNTKHEFIEDFMRPRTIINSTAIASATAATGFQVNGLGRSADHRDDPRNHRPDAGAAAGHLDRVGRQLGPRATATTTARASARWPPAARSSCVRPRRRKVTNTRAAHGAARQPPREHLRLLQDRDRRDGHRDGREPLRRRLLRECRARRCCANCRRSSKPKC